MGGAEKLNNNKAPLEYAKSLSLFCPGVCPLNVARLRYSRLVVDLEGGQHHLGEYFVRQDLQLVLPESVQLQVAS